MQVRLLAFAHAADVAGFRERLVECTPEETVRQIVLREAPTLSTEVLRVAVDCEYADWDVPVANAEEIALIPPVSGG